MTPEDVHEAVVQFWSKEVEVAPFRKGVAISLPIMYPSGWPVVVFADQINNLEVELTDGGRTLGWPLDCGEEVVELRRVVSVPLKGRDIFLFGEALVRLAYIQVRGMGESYETQKHEAGRRRPFPEVN